MVGRYPLTEDPVSVTVPPETRVVAHPPVRLAAVARSGPRVHKSGLPVGWLAFAGRFPLRHDLQKRIGLGAPARQRVPVSPRGREQTRESALRVYRQWQRTAARPRLPTLRRMDRVVDGRRGWFTSLPLLDAALAARGTAIAWPPLAFGRARDHVGAHREYSARWGGQEAREAECSHRVHLSLERTLA